MLRLKISLLLLLTLTLLWLIGSLLMPILPPFLIGMLLAYIGDPLVDKLERRPLSRTRSVTIVFAAISVISLGILLVIVPLLQQQLAILLARIPEYISYFQNHWIPVLTQWIPVDEELFSLNSLLNQLKPNIEQTGQAFSSIFALISGSGMALIYWVTNLLLLPLVTFYMLRDWDIWIAFLARWIPRPIHPTVVKLMQESDSMLGAFFRGQLLVAMLLGTIYSIGLWWVGLEFSLLIGMVAGLVSIAPYLGFIVGIALASIAALLQFHDWTPLLSIVAVFSIAQLIEGFFLTPWLLGDKLGLHPVLVLFAIMAGGELFGFWGILLALPVTAVLAVWLRHGSRAYLNSSWYLAP
ncbi:AI-2E family transporter [Ectothiorhodospiraceae bacterium BW-2]|nr:AI-2E family transporter [Ectothiorhodospiraceae bacterium BW-2]